MPPDRQLGPVQRPDIVLPREAALEHVTALRVLAVDLVRLGVSRDMASMLLDDFRDTVAHFGRHPIVVPLSQEESGGFSHL